jgi:hypothetical protein
MRQVPVPTRLQELERRKQQDGDRERPIGANISDREHGHEREDLRQGREEPTRGQSHPALLL